MNTEKLQKLKDKARQSLKILEALENGDTVQEIVSRLGVNRQLVDYYQKAVNEPISQI